MMKTREICVNANWTAKNRPDSVGLGSQDLSNLAGRWAAAINVKLIRVDSARMGSIEVIRMDPIRRPQSN